MQEPQLVSAQLTAINKALSDVTQSLYTLSGQVATLISTTDRLVSLQSRGPGRPKIDHPPKQCAAGPDCPLPDQLFVPKRPDQIYCSKECKLAGFRRVRAKQEVDFMIGRDRQFRPTVVMKTPEQEAQFLARVHEVGLAQALAEDDAS